MNYQNKTKEELEVELKIRDAIKAEQDRSDDAYAIKLVEKILFGLVALILTGVVVAILSLVLQNN